MTMLRYQDIAHTATRLRARTSLTREAGATVLPTCEAALLDRMRDYTLDGLPRRHRRSTPYSTAPLPTIADPLRVILVHMTQHPMQAVQGHLCDLLPSDANPWRQVVRPVVAEAVRRRAVVPVRRAAAMTPQAAVPPDEGPFCIMLVPNASSNDPSTQLHRQHTTAARRTVTP